MSDDPGSPPSQIKDWAVSDPDNNKTRAKVRIPHQWITWINAQNTWIREHMGTDFFFQVSQGLVNGYDSDIKYGRISGTTGTGTDDVVAPFVPTYLTAASTIRIQAGGNANDTAAGTGAQAIQIWGLDANYVEQTDTIVTAGASASTATTNTYLRVTRARATLVGSGEVNAGIITIEAVTGGSTQALITAGNGQTEQAFLTVPANQTAFLIGSRFSLADKPGAGNTQHLGHLKCWVRLYNESSNNNYESWRVVFDTGFDTDGTSNVPDHAQVSDPIPEKTDIKTTIQTHVANAECDARLFIVFKDN